MPKRVGRRTIEHWRDGECIARIEVTDDMIQRSEDGTARTDCGTAMQEKTMRDFTGYDWYTFIRAIAHQDPWSENVGFLLVKHETGKPRLVAKPLEFVELSAGAPCDPTFRLQGQEAQELMDGLWNCGLRPTQGKSSAGQLNAVERHLADMRAIAFNKLEIQPC